MNVSKYRIDVKEYGINVNEYWIDGVYSSVWVNQALVPLLQEEFAQEFWE